MRYADVYVSLPLEDGYTYRIPEGMELQPGMRVRVNFAGRKTVAFVYEIHGKTPDFEVKDVLEAVDGAPIFGRPLLELARYVSKNYLASMGETLGCALPSGLRPSSRYRPPFQRGDPKAVGLTGDQEEIYRNIVLSHGTERSHHLIFGITGSGKTEIYIKAAQSLMEKGLSVIYLVPEISLSSMIFERLYSVFGEDLIIYHSHLTANQRLHNWMRFNSGDARIAVGTRSAVFLQCPRLGMIVVDEEHDGSYKEHSSPRYNARRIAFYRSRAEGALVVMGSATPSVESLFACDQGLMRLHRLGNRFGSAGLPQIEIVKIDSTKPSGLISTSLRLHTRRAVDCGKQAIYLLNRRGFAPIVICNSCGWVVECPHCSISMNFHREGAMICHYCGQRRPLPDECGQCGSADIVKLGSGTQRMEEVIDETFRGLRIFRLDQDSSRKKGTVPDLIERMNRGDLDILIGTQLVAKGFDFHNVTVVGVLLADIGMNLPDFRSSERIFSLLMQVAGRSGRGEAPGRVIVQTLNDSNPVFKYIKNHDYLGFYKNEISIRRAMDYPPFTRLARLLVRGRDENRVAEAAMNLKKALSGAIEEAGAEITVLGPSSAPFSRIGGNYRHHIILKSGSVDGLRIVIAASRGAVTGKDLYLEIDIDPYDLL